MRMRIRPRQRPLVSEREELREEPDLREEIFRRFTEATELPLLVLTVVMVPLLILPLVMHLPPQVASTFETIDYFIWGIFAIEYVIKLTLTRRRLHYVVHNIPDLIVVVVPMLRPLRLVRSARALRLLRLARLGGFAGSGIGKARQSPHMQGVNYILAITTALILLTSIVVYDLERHARGSTIKSWPDGLWWAITTVTTVGYGDKVPVTAGARAVAVILMICGIALLSIITAAIATYFVSRSREGEAAKIDAQTAVETAQFDEINARLARIEAALASIAQPH